jgi:hypothetical protein
VLIQPHPWPALAKYAGENRLRTSIDSRRRSAPFSSSRSNAYMKTVASIRWCRRRSNPRDPGLAQAIASPSGARAQAGSGLGDKRKLARQVVTRTAVEPHPWPVLAGDDPEVGGLGALMGRHGWMKPAGRVRGRVNIRRKKVQLGRIARPSIGEASPYGYRFDSPLGRRAIH